MVILWMAIIVFFYLTWVSHRLCHHRAKWALCWAPHCWWTTNPTATGQLCSSPHQLSSTSLCPTEEKIGQKCPPRPVWSLLGVQWSQFSRATPPQGCLMGLPWNNYTSYTTYRGRGSSCIYWIGISFPFSHIFNTFLLWFVILPLHCTDTLKHLVQYRAFPKDEARKWLCVHVPLVWRNMLTWWHLAFHPLHLLQPTHHLCCHCHEASTKKRGFVPVWYPYWLW